MTNWRPGARRLDEWVVCVKNGHERFVPQRLYEARRVLECAGCGRGIGAGERLTIHRIGGAGTRAVYLCSGCAPFQPAEDRNWGR